MIDCQHDWNDQSALRLIVWSDDVALLAAFGGFPKVCHVEYCRECGLIRLPSDVLEAAKKAEALK